MSELNEIKEELENLKNLISGTIRQQMILLESDRGCFMRSINRIRDRIENHLGIEQTEEK